MDPEIHWLGETVGAIEAGRRYDCILYLHTLEHEADPASALARLSSFLAEGGLLLVEVPLGVFWEMRHLRDPITHLNFFCERSLFTLMERSGLSVLHLATRFQWVTTGRQWCINIVGVSGGGDSSSRRVRPKRPWWQETSPVLCAAKILDKIVGRVCRAATPEALEGAGKAGPATTR